MARTPSSTVVFLQISLPPIMGAMLAQFPPLWMYQRLKRDVQIAPWGRKSHVRDDLTLALKSEAEGGSGGALAFIQWMEKETYKYA